MSTNIRRRTAVTTRRSLEFSSINGLLAAAGLLSLVLGYLLLHTGSHVAAPLLLALGYVVLLPLAIIL